MNKNRLLAQWFGALMLLVTIVSCSDDDGPNPKGSFTTAIDEENTLTVRFTNTSQNASEYTWDFGDGTSSTEESPAHTYAEGGVFKVILIAKGNGGSNEYINFALPITPPPPIVNELANADFETNDNWEILQFGDNDVTMTIDGELKLTASGNVNSFIYQVIEVEAGKKYQFTGEITGNDLNSTWIEVYILEGETAPASDPSSGMFLGWSTWCDDASIDGNFTDAECNGSGSAHGKNGIIQFDTGGKKIFGIKAGICCGGTWGDGITMDNFLFTAIE
ncbi:PKD domain-containing protein [Fulvivirga ligni]|uniref:PKD domain-containing protein n=1 Tax=Fulvivirga ligni TaxID=2904246 RepID=UPI001F375DC7|nr:PKD domain-containing protein [Fulvivirga ligni]UII19605.1 PKD domain-containing protein [Fulvivirga ligni]